MIIQTIFFLALAAFIYLLARKYRSQSPAVDKAMSELGRFSGGLGRTIVVALSRIRLPKVARRPRPTTPKQASAGTAASPFEADHDFWKEEGSRKPELFSHFEEGETLFKKGRYQEAEQFFLKAAASKPNDAKVYARLGLLYLEQKSYSDAIEALKMAAKLEKYNPSRHYNLALAYWGNKDTRRAIASVREAIGLDPVTEKYRKLLEQLLNG